jgi:predicted transcriptional regulator
MSKSDYRVLEALADAEKLPVQTPSALAYNLDISRQQATRSLSTLMDEGLVTKVERGKYRITDAGREKVTSS